MAALPPPPSPTVEAIFQAREAAQTSGYRAHLGLSGAGAECLRSVWYQFRWATRARHTGRLLRLFERGDIEEARLVADLRRIGVTVLEVDETTGSQFLVRDTESAHIQGHMDAVAIGFREAPKTWHVCEFKTHSAKSFADLRKKGVKDAKPLHWHQMNAYMHLAGLERAFYLACNKDNDDLYQERVYHDPEAAIRLLTRARSVVAAAEPPVRISDDEASFACRFCDHIGVCHQGALPERQCRSCLHSTPISDGSWLCELSGQSLDKRQQEKGCPRHLFIPALVGGEQIDATDRTVTYRMPDGAAWVDGSPC